MKKYYPILLIPLFLFSMFIRIDATYITKNYVNDIELYKPDNEYLSAEVFMTIMNWIKTNYEDWYNTYDYAIAEDINNTNYVTVRLIAKNDPRVRYYFAKINDDTSSDVDWWSLIINSSSIPMHTITFSKTGTQLAGSGATGSVSISQAGRVYYTSLKAKVWCGYYTGQNSCNTLVDMTNFETRTLPSFMLVALGAISQNTADLMDNADKNTDRQLSFWESLAYNFGKWFLGQEEADDYKEAVLGGQNVDLWESLSPGNVWEAIYNAITFLADAVVGLILFIYKTLEFLVIGITTVVTTLISVASRTVTIITTLNSKLSSTPTFIQPIYQASFVMFPGLMGLSIIKFFIKAIRG